MPASPLEMTLTAALQGALNGELGLALPGSEARQYILVAHQSAIH